MPPLSPKHYAAIAALLAFLLLSGFAWVQTERLSAVKAELQASETKAQLIRDALITATTDANTFKAQAAAADVERAKVRTELTASLTRLRAKVPPTECNAAIDWAITNKGDLKW